MEAARARSAAEGLGASSGDRPREVRSAPIGRWAAGGGTRRLGTNRLSPALPRGRHFVCGRGPRAPFLLRAAILRPALGAPRTNLALRERQRRAPSPRHPEAAAGSRAPAGGPHSAGEAQSLGPGIPHQSRGPGDLANNGIYSSSEVSCVCSFFKKTKCYVYTLTLKSELEPRAGRPVPQRARSPALLVLHLCKHTGTAFVAPPQRGGPRPA